MPKRLVRILFVILGIGMMIGFCIYHIPMKTPINVTLDAIKIDEHGSEIGTVSIVMQGNLKEYVFRDTCLNVDISSFDGLSDIQPVVVLPSKLTGVVSYTTPHKLGNVIYSANLGDSKRVLIIYFSIDFQYWLICSRSPDHNNGMCYYLASTANSCSLTDLKDLFKGFIPEQ